MLAKKAKTFLLALIIAAPAYVLPYPGLMPGHKLYPIKQVFDRIYRFWVFGNFAGYKYELSLADKKLVEAKVLFEYQQYLLALKALKVSNNHFQQAFDYLVKAEKEGKDIGAKVTNLESAAERHQEVLGNLKNNLPAEFLWKPEKEEPAKLLISQSLDEAAKIRDFK